MSESLLELAKETALKVYSRNKHFDLDELVNQAYVNLCYLAPRSEDDRQLNKNSYDLLRTYAIKSIHPAKITNYAIESKKVDFKSKQDVDLNTKDSLSLEKFRLLSKAREKIIQVCEEKGYSIAYKIVFFGYTHKEASEEEGKPIQTAYNQMHKLRKCLSSTELRTLWEDLSNANAGYYNRY